MKARIATLSVTLGASLALASPAAAATQRIVIAHRGDAAIATENTPRAVKAAFANGAQGVEVDLRRTKDGRTIVMHDATVDRTTTCTGIVGEMTYDAIRKCRTKDGQQVPNLYDIAYAVKKYGGSTGVLWVHLKLTASDSKAKDIKAAIDKYGLWKRTVMMGDSSSALKEFSSGSTTAVKRAMIFSSRDTGKEAWDATTDYLVPYLSTITPALVAKAHSRGKLVLAVEDHTPTLEQIVPLGLDGVLANNVSDAVDLLR